jgi:hypothetical protein
VTLERRTPLHRGDQGLKRTEMKRSARSKRNERRPEGDLDGATWHALVIGRAFGRCEAELDGCTGKATEAHHRWRPGRRNVPANGVALCASCHTSSAAAVHRNEAWAYVCGLLIRSSGSLPDERWKLPEGEWRRRSG